MLQWTYGVDLLLRYGSPARLLSSKLFEHQDYDGVLSLNKQSHSGKICVRICEDKDRWTAFVYK